MSYFVNNSLTKLEGTFLGHRVYSRKLNLSFLKFTLRPNWKNFDIETGKDC